MPIPSDNPSLFLAHPVWCSLIWHAFSSKLHFCCVVQGATKAWSNREETWLAPQLRSVSTKYKTQNHKGMQQMQAPTAAQCRDKVLPTGVFQCRDLVIWKVSGFSVSLPARAVLAREFEVSTKRIDWGGPALSCWHDGVVSTTHSWSMVGCHLGTRGKTMVWNGWHLTMAHRSIRTQLGETTHNEGLGAAPSKSSPEISISVWKHEEHHSLDILYKLIRHEL